MFSGESREGKDQTKAQRDKKKIWGDRLPSLLDDRASHLLISRSGSATDVGPALIGNGLDRKLRMKEFESPVNT